VRGTRDEPLFADESRAPAGGRPEMGKPCRIRNAAVQNMKTRFW